MINNKNLYNINKIKDEIRGLTALMFEIRDKFQAIHDSGKNYSIYKSGNLYGINTDTVIAADLGALATRYRDLEETYTNRLTIILCN